MAMSPQDSLVSGPSCNEIQHPERNTSYCSECLEKFFDWGVFEQSYTNFHRDIYKLIDCGDRCELCRYICSLFGRPHLEDTIARANEYNMQPVETLGPDAAKTIVYHNGGFRSLLPISRDPKPAPTISIYYDNKDSIFDANGYLDHAVIDIGLTHHVAKWEDRRLIDLYTKAGRAFHRPIWSESNSLDFRERSATIREWLTECETYHPDCRRSMKPDVQLATRILSVQEQEINCYSIKLVSTKGIDLHHNPYVVLSHAWGGIEIPCKTTKSNVTQYYDIGIYFDDLPKTFQDAVRLTVAIGFQYLWVDSLCIIQDDIEDWQRESARMAAIYGAGTITLSATSADNSHGGCGLSPKLQSVTRFCSVDSGRPDFAARKITGVGNSPTDILKKQLRDGPVNTRAWILQEKMLSRRILHATYSQFVWECNVVKESEDGTIYDQKAYLPLEKAWRTRYREFPKAKCGDDVELDVYEFERRWWDCATDYSKRSLGRTSDQYAALAGIVQSYQELSGDRPIVGLWERHLTFHLSWEVLRDDGEQETLLLEPAGRRPSWTWMSFSHGTVKLWPTIQWRYLSKNRSTPESMGIVYQAKILGTDIKWSSQPLTSDPSGSTICIRGIMRRMRKPKPVRTARFSPLRLDPGIIDENGGNGEYETFALFSYGLRAALTNQPPVVTTVYLILQAVGAEDANTYIRIGTMQLTKDFDMGGGLEYMYLPEGVQRDITLV